MNQINQTVERKENLVHISKEVSFRANKSLSKKLVYVDVTTAFYLSEVD